MREIFGKKKKEQKKIKIDYPERFYVKGYSDGVVGDAYQRLTAFEDGDVVAIYERVGLATVREHPPTLDPIVDGE